MGCMKITALAAFMLMLVSCGQVASSSFTAYDIEPIGGIVDLRITDPGLSLEKVNFAAAGQNGKFRLSVYRLSAGEVRMYEYFRVLTERLQAEPKDVVMDFRISKAWIAEKNADMDTVSLNIFDEHSASWKRLQSVKFSEDTEFLHYRALSSPSLEGFFQVTAEPVPVDIQFTVRCNGNGVCEPGKGEDADSCSRDCAAATSYARCIPLKTYCLGNSVLTCNEDGSDYSEQACADGCSEGRCSEYAPATAGMALLGASPFFIVLIVLASLVAYLLFSFRSLRKRLFSAERLR